MANITLNVRMTLQEFNLANTGTKHLTTTMDYLWEIAALCPEKLSTPESRTWETSYLKIAGLKQLEGTANLLSACDSMRYACSDDRRKARQRIFETCMYFHLAAAIELAEKGPAYAVEFSKYLAKFYARYNNKVYPFLMSSMENFLAIRDLVCEHAVRFPEALRALAIDMIVMTTPIDLRARALLMTSYALDHCQETTAIQKE